MDLLRVLRGSARVITLDLETEGSPVDADGVVLVTVTNDAGVVLEMAQAATHLALGSYSFTLSPTDLAALDSLTVTWAATIAAVAFTSSSVVEVVGGFWFDVPAARARPELAPFTDAEIAQKRTAAEWFLEDQTSVSWVPRYRRETQLLDASPRLLVLERGDVSRLRSLTVDGTALASDVVAALRVSRDGVLDFGGTSAVRPLAGAAFGDQVQIDVAYEYGRAWPSPRAGQTALILARHYLLNGPLDDRAIALSVEGGVVSLLTPGVRGSVTGIPEVDQFLIDAGRERSIA